ncbi:MAG: 50S ribosomal protein L10 [Saprospiraceae bacterium]|nr:50S ribosomal protein L10 [Saprospiraceae bacterium]
MTRADKTAEIARLKEKFEQQTFFYLTDTFALSVDQINRFRRLCFEKGIEVFVAKNTLVKKALEAIEGERGYAPLFDILHGPTTLMFSDNAKLPAKVIEEFRKEFDKPVLKAAYIDSDVFIGDDQIKELIKLKTKEEVIADIIAMLEGPIQGVLGGLNSGANTIYGLLDAIEAKG